MNYYALIYDYVDDYLERRGAYRPAHFELAKAAEARGELVLGGAFSDPADKAVLVFRVASKEAVEEFVRQDPYVQNGIVTGWEIRPWMVVIGTAYAAG